ncbi:hypothetical protein ElyMa_006928000 [Elysia marginata]|uniref:EGF-like domain-containing protein n=1 Tax=Elysia marginata TaxID=1093978 RepID=A0AAV4JGR5_9GAST|nr:hypothetical protein ElyMa_006928000 [Elysia marginata]
MPRQPANSHFNPPTAASTLQHPRQPATSRVNPLTAASSRQQPRQPANSHVHPLTAATIRFESVRSGHEEASLAIDDIVVTQSSACDMQHIPLLPSRPKPATTTGPEPTPLSPDRGHGSAANVDTSGCDIYCVNWISCRLLKSKAVECECEVGYSGTRCDQLDSSSDYLSGTASTTVSTTASTATMTTTSKLSGRSGDFSGRPNPGENRALEAEGKTSNRKEK